MHSPYLMGGMLDSTSLWNTYTSIWNFSAGESCLFSPAYLFMQSFICVSVDS